MPQRPGAGCELDRQTPSFDRDCRDLVEVSRGRMNRCCFANSQRLPGELIHQPARIQTESVFVSFFNESISRLNS